jgi:hypothetical protein
MPIIYFILMVACMGSKRTPSVSDLEVVLNEVWVKHWEDKSSITFKLLSLQM